MATASIAAIQPVARLSAIAAAFFKATSEFRDLQLRYEMELQQLRTMLQVLRPRASDSWSIPMHVFEELYLELRKQAVALERLQMAEKRLDVWKLKSGLRNIKDQRRIEEFVHILHRYCEILSDIARINDLAQMRAEVLSPSSKESVFAQSYLVTSL